MFTNTHFMIKCNSYSKTVKLPSTRGNLNSVSTWRWTTAVWPAEGSERSTQGGQGHHDGSLCSPVSGTGLSSTQSYLMTWWMVRHGHTWFTPCWQFSQTSPMQYTSPAPPNWVLFISFSCFSYKKQIIKCINQLHRCKGSKCCSKIR